METILIADSQEIVRMGIRATLESLNREFTILEAGTCHEVTCLLSSQPVQYVILEMFLTDGNIFSSVNRFIDFVRFTSVLVYSSNENLYARRLMQKGIRGFISKNASVQELQQAIECLLKGEIYLSAAMKEELFKPGNPDVFKNPVDALSDRELEVAEYITAGYGPTEIAEKMKLDVTTISTYRRRAFDKLGVKNIIEMKEKFLLYKMQG